MEKTLQQDAGIDEEEKYVLSDGDDSVEEDVEDTTDEDADEVTEEDSGTDDESEEVVEEDVEEIKQRQDIDDTTGWVKKRLARAEKSFERSFMSEANSMSDGVQLARTEVPQAVRLWNMLKHNPDLSGAVQQMITQQLTEGKAKYLSNFKDAHNEDAIEARYELRESKLDLRTTDSVFRRYEKDILDWADDEGLPINNAKELRRVYREWKGENSRKLIVQAETRGQKKALDQKAQKTSAHLEGKKSPVKGQEIDYGRASVKDVLKHERLSLFTKDD